MRGALANGRRIVELVVVSNRTWVLAAPIVLVLGALTVFSGTAPAEDAQPATIEPTPTTEILFVGHPYSFIEDAEVVLTDATIFDPDLIVFGGDSLWNNTPENERYLTDAVAFAETRAEQVLLAKGNHDITADVFDDRPAYGWYRTDDVISIVVDTTVQGVGGESCGLDPAQLQMIQEAVEQEATHRILFTHHALFANETFIADMRPNTLMECVGDYWQREVLPIISDKVSLVVSGDGGVPIPFAMTERDGIRYVISGSPIHERVRGGPNSGGPVLATFVRIRADEANLLVDRVSLPDRALLEPSALEGITRYEVTVDEAEFLDLYQTAPMYEFGTDWQAMIEDENTTEFLQRPIAAIVNDGAADLPAELSIRGNVGNHWRTYKKSWDISFEDPDRRQLKLILPSDRGYTSQKLAQIVSDRLAVPTPDIDLARMRINDHDFGVYLVYEDFDKAFIELAGYGSDTRPAKNSFRDHFDAYPVDRSLTRVQTSGGAGDRSDQQAIAGVEFTAENMHQYFERDAFARWLAVQMFLGDKHQNEADNFRFFLDRSTGRFIMVNWDSGLATIESSEPVPSSRLGQTFYANPDNKALTDQYLQQLIADGPAIRSDFEAVIAQWLPVFQNDPGLETTQNILERSLQGQLEQFDANLAVLGGQ